MGSIGFLAGIYMYARMGEFVVKLVSVWVNVCLCLFVC